MEHIYVGRKNGVKTQGGIYHYLYNEETQKLSLLGLEDVLQGFTYIALTYNRTRLAATGQAVSYTHLDVYKRQLYKQPYRRPGVRAGCWHRPGRRRRGWRPPCYPGQAQRLPRRRLFWFWFSLRGWWGRFWLLPSACSFPTKRHRTGCSCGRRRQS